MNSQKLSHILSMTDPKYLPMMGLPLIVPYLAGGSIKLWILGCGIFAVVILNLAAVLVNTYADQRADAVNFPTGASNTAKYIGYRRLIVWIVLLYALLLLASVVIWTTVSREVAVIYTIGWIIATSYSVGPRLKRSLLFSRLAMAAGPSFAFAGGWALHRPLSELPAAILLLFVGQSVHTLLKDVPDAAGDRQMGVRTLFTGLSTAQLRLLLPALWTLPYLLMSVGIFLGWWPARYAFLWLLYPFALLVVRSPFYAEGPRERELVRELAQFFSTCYVLLNLLLFAPTPLVLGVCGVTIIYYISVLSLGIDRRGQGHGLAELWDFSRRLIRSTLLSIKLPAHS